MISSRRIALAKSTSRCIISLSVRLYSTRTPSKIVSSASEALAPVRSGMTVLSGGFGLCGVPTTLLNALSDKTDVRGLTAVSNNPGVGDKGLAKLLNEQGKVSRLVCSYLGNNKTLEGYYRRGEIAVELTPQGNIAERLSAASRGVPAFFTSTGVGTAVEDGSLVTEYTVDGKPLSYQPRCEIRVFGDKQYMLQTALHADIALVRAKYADTAGNLIFNSSAHNFNSVMAKAANCTIVEAEQIVDVGELSANAVHVSGIYVDRVCQATTATDVEVLTTSDARDSSNPLKDTIARRAAKEVRPGDYVNLGVGIPGRVPEFIPEDANVTVQSENGLLSIGAYPDPEHVDPDTINASKETVTLRPGAAAFGSDESFGMIRSGRIDVSMLGAFQVDQSGNLANYMIPGKLMKGMGGAMDLVSNPSQTRVVVLMEHTDKYGRSKLLKQCDLPLTGKACVWKIITELAAFSVDKESGMLVLTDVANGVTLDDVRRNTDAEYTVSAELGSY